MLQASPSPLSSVSVCSGLLSNGQLSQRSPTPSLSESNCRGLYTDGQLSYAKHTHSCMHTHRGCEYVYMYPQSYTMSEPQSHPLIYDVIIVIIRITGISQSVSVQVFLSRVWKPGAIILQPVTPQISEITFNQINQIRIFLFLYLLTVIGCVLLAG